MRYLVNPKGSRRAKSRRKKRRRSAAQRAATAKMLAANKSRRRTRRRRRASSSGLTRAPVMAKRRRSRRRKVTARRRRRRNPGALSVNPRRRVRRRRSVSVARRRSRRRRNPPMSLTGITRTIVRGVQDAAVIVGGEMVSNLIANQIPMFLSEKKADGTVVETMAGRAIRQAIAAAGVGVAASYVLHGQPDLQRIAVAGALATPVRGFIKPLLPTDPTSPFSGLLSAGRMVRLASYPGTQTAALMAAYPQGLSAGPGAIQAPGYGYTY